jgi:hypothetical protein
MLRWQALPGSLDPRVRQLVVQMRKLKDHSGLSLAALAVKTPYSKSSWERYLNGRTLPPPGAVAELARVTGADPARLLALHKVAGEAAQAQSARPVAVPEGAAPAGAAGAEGGGRPPPPPRRGLGWLVAGVAAGAVLGGTALAVAAPWDSETAPSGRTRRAALVTAHDGAFPAHPRGKTYRCDIEHHGGRTYAGHSTTREKVVEINSIGWEVVEAQCLLREAGFSPRGTDGIYGENTVNAVKRFQKDKGLADDGAVGPDTWKALRE